MSITRVTTDLPNKEQGDVCQIISPGVGVTITSLPYPPSINMTFSIWWRSVGSETTVIVDAVGAHEETVVSTEWKRYSIVADPPDGRDVDIIPSSSIPIQIYMAQLEQGGSASDWHPAPEDDEEAIEANKKAVMKITPEYIITTVTESEPYNELTGTVTKHETSITQNAREISLRATKQEFDELAGDAITTKNAELKITPEMIESAVSSTTVVKGKASASDLQALESVAITTNNASQKITATMIESAVSSTTVVKGKASDSDLTGLKNIAITTENATQKITPGMMQNLVSKTTMYDDIYGVEQGGTDGIKYKSEHALQTITPTMIDNTITSTTYYTDINNAIGGKVGKNDTDYISKVTMNEVTNTIGSTYIENKVGNTTYDFLDPQHTSTYAQMSSIKNTADTVTAKVTNMRSGGSNLLVRAGMIKTYLNIEDGSLINPNADPTDDSYTSPVTTNYYIPVSAETKDFTINLYDKRTAETGLYMIFCEYGENKNFIKYQQWVGLIEPGHKTFTVGDSTKFIRATVDGYPHYRWKLEHGNLASDWTGANEELIVSSEMQITANQVLFKTPEFAVDIYTDGGSGQKLRIDKEGATFQRVFAPNICKQYCESYAVNIFSATDFQTFLSSINGTQSIGDISVFFQSSISGQFSLYGIGGGGHLRFQGSSQLTMNLSIEGCTKQIEFNGLNLLMATPAGSTSYVQIYIENSSFVRFNQCKFTNVGATANGSLFWVQDDSQLEIYGCEIYNYSRMIDAYSSRVLMFGNNRGGIYNYEFEPKRMICFLSGCLLNVAGTLPFTDFYTPDFQPHSGQSSRPSMEGVSSIFAPSNFAQLISEHPGTIIPDDIPVPSTFTTTIPGSISGTYVLINNKFNIESTNRICQGTTTYWNKMGEDVTETNLKYYGWIYFELPSGLTESSIQSASLRITRTSRQSNELDVASRSVRLGVISGNGSETKAVSQNNFNYRSSVIITGTSSNYNATDSIDVTNIVKYSLYHSGGSFYRGRILFDGVGQKATYCGVGETNSPILSITYSTS